MLFGLFLSQGLSRYKSMGDDPDTYHPGFHVPAVPAGESVSPTGQTYSLETGTKNAENIRKLTVDTIFRELCPVWKPALPGGPSIFENGTS